MKYDLLIILIIHPKKLNRMPLKIEDHQSLVNNKKEKKSWNYYESSCF